MIPNPCTKTCPDRSSTCHATCKKYKEFREEKDREMHIRYQANNNMTNHPNKMKSIYERMLGK